MAAQRVADRPRGIICGGLFVQWILPAILAGLAFLLPAAASAEGDTQLERLRAAMQSARWTGPMLASNAETLPHGHFYTEPYFFDVIQGGDHHPGSSGFYQYGLFDNFTVGVQPSFSLGTDSANRGMALGDFKLLSQLRLTHFTPEHQIPTIALVLNAALPTGKYDHLGELKTGHGSGSFAPEAGLNVQQYFLLRNDRLLRARLNLLRTFPFRADVSGRSVYGTGDAFHGRAKPGPRTAAIAAVEYSLTNEWVLAIDVEADHWGSTSIHGREDAGPLIEHNVPKSWNVGFSPAIEYNWDAKTGALFGVWIVPKGHNTASSVTPAIAISRFW
jgi:hypothetical protein